MKKDERKWLVINLIVLGMNMLCAISGFLLLIPWCVLPLTVPIQIYAIMEYLKASD